MHEQLDCWAVVAITCAVYWDADTALLHGLSTCELVVLCWGCVDGSEVSVVAAWLTSAWIGGGAVVVCDCWDVR